MRQMPGEDPSLCLMPFSLSVIYFSLIRYKTPQKYIVLTKINILNGVRGPEPKRKMVAL